MLRVAKERSERRRRRTGRLGGWREEGRQGEVARVRVVRGRTLMSMRALGIRREGRRASRRGWGVTLGVGCGCGCGGGCVWDAYAVVRVENGSRSRSRLDRQTRRPPRAPLRVLPLARRTVLLMTALSFDKRSQGRKKRRNRRLRAEADCCSAPRPLPPQTANSHLRNFDSLPPSSDRHPEPTANNAVRQSSSSFSLPISC